MHPLHKVIGDAIVEADLPGCTVVRDPACGGDHNIPLFCSESKSKHTEYCDVDLLILRSDTTLATEHEKVRVIVEIEEANITPVQICGKFFACALSPYFIHEGKKSEPIPMADSVLFVQILDTSKLKADRSAKMGQGENIERSIQKAIPIKHSGIDQYKLLYGDSNDFTTNGARREQLLDCIRTFLVSARQRTT